MKKYQGYKPYCHQTLQIFSLVPKNKAFPYITKTITLLRVTRPIITTIYLPAILQIQLISIIPKKSLHRQILIDNTATFNTILAIKLHPTSRLEDMSNLPATDLITKSMELDPPRQTCCSSPLAQPRLPTFREVLMRNTIMLPTQNSSQK